MHESFKDWMKKIVWQWISSYSFVLRISKCSLKKEEIFVNILFKINIVFRITSSFRKNKTFAGICF